MKLKQWIFEFPLNKYYSEYYSQGSFLVNIKKLSKLKNVAGW